MGGWMDDFRPIIPRTELEILRTMMLFVYASDFGREQKTSEFAHTALACEEFGGLYQPLLFLNSILP
jgi:hypothetical protein